MSTRNRIPVLCVDDEPNVLEGLKLHLNRHYRVYLATSGAEGLEVLRRHPEIAVVLSDMRMPAMDGAQFLAQARVAVPLAVRMLLTGETQVSRAVSAVNDGGLFRFLTKPCAPAELLAAFHSAVEQHRLLSAEKELLQKTLIGSIRALVDILALANPAAFGCATRIQREVRALAKAVGIKSVWQVEAAAMLSQLGSVALPDKTVGKMRRGERLNAEEQQQVDKMPETVCKLLGHIPRLEPVLELIRGAATDDSAKASKAAQVLKLAIDYDELQMHCDDAEMALATLRGRGDRYDSELIAQFTTLKGVQEKTYEVVEIPVPQLKEGMLLAEELIAKNGMLLVGKGIEVTASFLARLSNFGDSLQQMTVRVMVEGDPAQKVSNVGGV